MTTCDGIDEAELDRLSSCMDDKLGQDCVAEIEEAGYEHLGSGDTRVVFEIPGSDCVVKMTKRNGLSNKREVQAWENGPPGMEDALLPVVEYDEDDHSWLVMPEAEMTPYSPQKIRTIRDKISKTGWRCKDTNPGNVGEYNGEIVLIDYGEGCGEHGLGKPY